MSRFLWFSVYIVTTGICKTAKTIQYIWYMHHKQNSYGVWALGSLHQKETKALKAWPYSIQI